MAKYCDDPNCDRDAEFVYVWPGTEARYRGCEKHAIMAKHAVANMGRELQLIPIGADGEPAAAATAVPAGASAEPGLKAAVENLHGAIQELTQLLRSGAGVGVGPGMQTVDGPKS
jgi:hypothetical protein